MQQRQLPDTGESGVQRQKKWEGGKGSREKGWAGPEKRIGIPDGACVRACVQVVLVLVLPSMPICVLGGREEEKKQNKTNAGRRASDMKGGKAGTVAVNHTRDWHVTGREETNDRCVSVAVLASRHRSLRRGGE